MSSLLSLTTAFLATSMVVAGIDLYDSRYDNFDVMPLIENDRIMAGFINCFLGKGACTPDGKDFKKAIPEAMETSCGKCTPRQKELIKKVINTLIQRHPEAWTELLDKFDPEHKHKETLDEFLKNP